MPDLKTYNIFISHAWKYGENYDRLIKLLDDAPNFYYRNYSSPKDKLFIPPYMYDLNDTIKNKIVSKIRRANCVLFISGMFALYKNLMLVEIEIALELEKPIICIKPSDDQVIPPTIYNAADEIVDWDTSSIVDAIRKLSI